MKQTRAVKLVEVLQRATRCIAVVALLSFAWGYPATLSAQDAPMDRPAAVGESGENTPPLKPHLLGDAGKSEKKPAAAPSILPLVGSLIFVLGLFFALAWAMRRMSPAGAALLPAEAFEMLGRAPLANRQQANLIRCGNKLLLISVGAAGATTLAEIANPTEVEQLSAMCRQARQGNAAAALRRAFWQKGKE